MRLLVVVNAFHPDRGGGSAVFSDLCYGLAQQGLDVTVRCPYPYYPEWRDKSGKNGWSIWRYEDCNVKVERFGLFIPRDPSSLWQRVLFEGTFLLSLLRALPKDGRFNAVMVYCPLVSAIAYAWLVKLFFHVPIWLNIQDISADAAAATKIARFGLVIKILSAIERFLFNRADVWSTISPVMADRLLPMRRNQQSILFMPNWVDATMAEALRVHRNGRPSPERGQEPLLLYAGNVGAKQNLLEFCKFLHESDVPFHFRIFGSGAKFEEISNWLHMADDARFMVGPFLDVAELAKELIAADFYVITERQGVGGSFFPSKMVTGMLSGIPILAVCDVESPLGREMHEAEPGPRFEWKRLNGVVELLQNFKRDKEDVATWRRNAINRAACYDRNKIITRFRKNITSLVKGESLIGWEEIGNRGG